MLKPVGIIRKFSGFKRETSVWSQQCRDSELNCIRLCVLKLDWPEAAMEKSLQVAPHSLALVLSQACTGDKEDSPSSSSLSPSPSSSSSPPPPPAALSVNLQHHTGYEVFASFKSVNMQHFWNKALTHALSEMFFLGWIDECVLLIQGKEVHLQVLRNAWNRRTLKPPQGFNIKCIGGFVVVVVVVASHAVTLSCEHAQGGPKNRPTKADSSTSCRETLFRYLKVAQDWSVTDGWLADNISQYGPITDWYWHICFETEMQIKIFGIT